MNTVETFQISSAAAEAYEAAFVPRLFGRWSAHLLEAAQLAAGQSVLDVACGTGVVARGAADRLGGRGRIVGLDLNENMLAVARRLRPELEWRQGNALQLPFGVGEFDRVLCQSALMFFPDPAQALGEMARVARRNGIVAVQVWNRLEAQPAYAPFVDVAARHAGPDAIRLLGTYWSLGDPELLGRLFEAGGLEITTVRTLRELAHFASIDELVAIEVESTPLIERIGPEVYRRIVEDTREALRSFCTDEGKAEIPLEGHIITARQR
jgi:ubiquinone/menaquinone biosynthesis C-methylase UbiE